MDDDVHLARELGESLLPEAKRGRVDVALEHAHLLLDESRASPRSSRSLRKAAEPSTSFSNLEAALLSREARIRR